MNDMTTAFHEFLHNHQHEIDTDVYDALDGFCKDADEDDIKREALNKLIHDMFGEEAMDAEKFPADPVDILDLYEDYLEEINH